MGVRPAEAPHKWFPLTTHWHGGAPHAELDESRACGFDAGNSPEYGHHVRLWFWNRGDPDGRDYHVHDEHNRLVPALDRAEFFHLTVRDARALAKAILAATDDLAPPST